MSRKKKKFKLFGFAKPAWHKKVFGSGASTPHSSGASDYKGGYNYKQADSYKTSGSYWSKDWGYEGGEYFDDRSRAGYSYSYSSYYGENKGSASSYWTSRFYDSSNRDEYTDILNTVSRSANILENSTTDGKERILRVRWSNDEQANSIGDDYVYLSPDVIADKTTLKKKWTKEQRTDVLVGQALSESAIKNFADFKAEKIVQNVDSRVESKYSSQLWFAQESLNAMRKVLNDFPGFKAYFSAMIEYYTDDGSQESIQNNIKKKEPHSKVVIQAILWNLMHPDLPLELKKYEEIVKYAIDQIEKSTTSIQRASTAAAIAHKIAEMFPHDDDIPDINMGLGPGHGDSVSNGINVDLASAVADTEPGGSSDGGSINEPPAGYHEQIVSGNFSDAYNKLVVGLLPTINAMKNKLKLKNESPCISEHGLATGYLDEGSLYKLGFFPLGYDDQKLFEEQSVISCPKIAVGLLVDESGSMNDDGSIIVARNLAIVLANALNSIEGVDIAVLGHTGQGCGFECHSDGLILHHYYTPKSNNLTSIAAMRAYCQNLDGYAISKVSNYMVEWYEKHPTKILVHISDGLPCANGYGGQSAMTHIRKVSNQAKKNGVDVIGICIGQYFTDAQCNAMYGDGSWVRAENAEMGSVAISNLIVKTVMTACTLA